MTSSIIGRFHKVLQLRDYFLLGDSASLRTIYRCSIVWTINQQDKYISSFLVGRIAALSEAVGDRSNRLLRRPRPLRRKQNYCLPSRPRATNRASPVPVGRSEATLTKAAEGLRVYCLIDACFSGEAVPFHGAAGGRIEKQLDEAEFYRPRDQLIGPM
jgi:hypothetical protein